MPTITAHPVYSRSQRTQFLQLPWKLHLQNPYWVPPLRSNQKELVGYTPHPFLDDAEIQTFLAWQGNRLVGRIAALVNHAHNRQHQENRGFFGFFESIHDQEVAKVLFDAARSWLAEKGIHTLRGPTNPSLNYECGLLVDGFDSAPTFMIPYNPPYYASLLETYGFHKAQDLYSLCLPLVGDQLEKTLNKNIAYISEQVIQRFDVQIRQLNTARFAEEINNYFHLYNSSMQQTWGFVPMSAREMQHLSNSLKHLIVPELTSIAEVDGKPVGAVFALPDYNPRIKAINGRLFPIGFIRLLWGRKSLKRARVLTANVLPEYQSWGLGVALVYKILPVMVAWGLEVAEFSWVAESNQLSKGSLERAGARITKTHRIYDLDSHAMGGG